MQALKRLGRRVVAAAASVAVAAVAAVALDAAPAMADPPPGIPSKSTAQSQLNALTVAAESHSGSYDRSLFPHWSSVSGTCNAREYVLRRDGHNVTVGSNCYPTSGSWYSDFDNTWSSCVSCTSIDHVVALKEAWESGAWSWTTSRRQAFANDVASPQLWAVSASVNSSKGAKDPAEWIPPHSPARCDYAKAWINVKYRYGLSVDAAEKNALQSQLSTYC